MASDVPILYQPPDGSNIRWQKFASDSAQARLLELARPSIVRISVTIDPLRSKVGTGFFISPGLLATAWHVVDHPGPITITTADGLSYWARIQRARTDLDIAVLSVGEPTWASKAQLVLGISEAGSTSVLELATAGAAEGDFAVCIGHAEGRRDQVLSDGEFLRATETIREDWERECVTAELIYHDYTLAVRGGNSGGPVLDIEGRVRSIVVESPEIRESFEVGGPRYWSQAIPAAYLLELLQQEFDSIRGYEPLAA